MNKQDLRNQYENILKQINELKSYNPETRRRLLQIWKELFESEDQLVSLGITDSQSFRNFADDAGLLAVGLACDKSKISLEEIFDLVIEEMRKVILPYLMVIDEKIANEPEIIKDR